MDTVSVTTQAEWDREVHRAAAIDVLPGPGKITLDLAGADPAPQVHVAPHAIVETRGAIELSCAGRIILHPGARVELVPEGRAIVDGGALHARAGTVVEAVSGEITCESGSAIFTRSRGNATLRVDMAPGVMWWDVNGSAHLTSPGVRTIVTATEITREPITTIKENPMPTSNSTRSAIEAHLTEHDRTNTQEPLPAGVDISVPLLDLVVAVSGDPTNG